MSRTDPRASTKVGACFALVFAFSAIAACGSDDTTDEPASTGPREPPRRPTASCDVLIEAPAFLSSPHVQEGSAIQYNSNPPSSGPHYPVWAHFTEYNAPVPLPYLVHSMEHGAVLLLYKCSADAGACDVTVEALRKVRDAIPTDPACDAATRVRVILAPEPSLDVPVAAAAWGYTYKAQCVDAPTLTAFANEHYAKGPENFCSPGRTF